MPLASFFENLFLQLQEHATHSFRMQHDDDDDVYCMYLTLKTGEPRRLSSREVIHTLVLFDSGSSHLSSSVSFYFILQYVTIRKFFFFLGRERDAVRERRM